MDRIEILRVRVANSICTTFPATIINRLANGEIWLLTIYAKGERSTIPAHELKLIKEAIDDD